MKYKAILLIICLYSIASQAIAGHIAGGEVFYTFMGKNATNDSSKYHITLRLFRKCHPLSNNGQAPAELPDDLYMGIYKNTDSSDIVSSGLRGTDLFYVKRSSKIQINLNTYNPCIKNPPEVCYEIGLYEFDVLLADIPEGYTVGYQTCCRTNFIENVQPQFIANQNSAAEGATYACEIPGTNVLGKQTNSSPVFAVKDTTLVCAGSKFKLDFSATDPDSRDFGDSLSYQFCSAYNRGNTDNAYSIDYSNPPYQPVTYNLPYSGSQPLGPLAFINDTTGIISGIAPETTGAYVVNVCITEWRKGRPISSHRKDFTLEVTGCLLSAAALSPTYPNCSDSTVPFHNLNGDNPNYKYKWFFGDVNSPIDTSSLAKPTHIYSDTGTFTVKLNVELPVNNSTNGTCKDSTTAIVKIYPGFKANFIVKASCINNPYLFIDSSYTKYGKVDNWQWDLGEPTVTTDTSSKPNVSYLYPTTGKKTVTLSVVNTTGCVDTKTEVIDVEANPTLHLPFKDTLICYLDTIQLHVNEVNASGKEKFAWTPKQFIINDSTANPYVYPTDTAWYYVHVADQGCFGNDSVRVNVLKSITVNLGPDTIACKADTFHLNAVSNGLSFIWTSNTGDIIAPVQKPLVQPVVNPTYYYVVARLGNGCKAKDTLQVQVFPYPGVNAGVDAAVCFGKTVPLHGTIVGSVFSWSPGTKLLHSDSTILNPVAVPDSTTGYVLTVIDTAKLACPKPSRDTIKVVVYQKVRIDAGSDTSVVANQPLQFAATGNVDTLTTNYSWVTLSGLPTYMDNPNIYNPIAILPPSTDSVTYILRVSTDKGCFGADSVKVLVFNTGPEIFVPSAFTPNGDGRNDVEIPIPVGLIKLVYFSIYNRWGQLLYTTNQLNQGWDGNFKGEPQPPGTYVYVTVGEDYHHKVFYRKGTVVLIR
ncbi:PKD domain-containing protein [Parasediminibacterium sp. JCM 36343]|uniref:PKD domain-containing protein n=1 Tax=Parasediminibacterium sp. JCM 36343 TaxID=3374279 RepID=UPI00397E5020